MGNDLYTKLSWLLPPPSDVSDQIRALARQTEGLGTAIRQLATFFLDETQLLKLSREVARARADGRSLEPLQPFRLGVISNATTDYLTGALIGTAARYGFALECVTADYGQTIQEALSSTSKINSARVDAVLLAFDYRGVPLRLMPGASEEDAVQAVRAALDELQLIRSGFREHGNTICIVQTLARPVEPLFGSLDFVLPGTWRNLLDRYNRGVVNMLRDSGDLLLDVAALAETVGLADWHEPTLWNMAKIPFSTLFVPLYADHVCRLIGAQRGRSRRCLILDLDNTVWGGIIGDDGLQGILIAEGDATGEAHRAVQKTALDLRQRGIVLAVSSKNEDEIARSAFRQHPEMLLREEHVAVFQANWNDKATNIRAIADELSLGLESMVFLDDNPAERKLVREMLPQVGVPELPEDPALYIRTLLAAGYFEALSFSNEDAIRANMYQDNARRVALQKQAGHIEGYLRSLEMTMIFSPFDATGRARISQLINKSNQFNLTTRRYREVDVAAMEKDPNAFTMQVRLVDKLGDNGMISVIICRTNGDDWKIDTWLMSCRVLGRGVEETVLDELCRHAAERRIKRLVGTYIPTARNKLVENHYANLGFKLLKREEDGTTIWERHVTGDRRLSNLMSVQRLGYSI
jgi:FkbH-like protein